MDRNARMRRSGLIVAGLLALAMAMSPVVAQEVTADEPAASPAEPDAIGPAVDTSADAAAADAELDALEPGVPSAVLAADVTRSAAGGQVMDRIELGRTEITGNQELPKVMYIVPWQKADPSDLVGRPVNTLLDEVLAPIDREEFVRQVGYYDDLYGEDEQQERRSP